LTNRQLGQIGLDCNGFELKCLHPFIEVEVIRPTVKAAAESPRPFDHISKTPVASRNYAFKQGGLRVMYLDFNPVAPPQLPQKPLLALDRFNAFLCAPLKRSMRLGNKV